MYFDIWGFERHWGLAEAPVFKIELYFENNSVFQFKSYIKSEIPPFVKTFLWTEFANNLIYMPITF